MALPVSPAANILSKHSVSWVVSTFPLPESYSSSPSERVGVSVGWKARSSDKAPGLVPQPIMVRPIPDMGTYIVSYGLMSEESTLLGLPSAVERLIGVVQSGGYRPRG